MGANLKIGFLGAGKMATALASGSGKPDRASCSRRQATIAFPLRYLFQRRKAAGDLWDITGFAYYVLARRPA